MPSFCQNEKKIIQINIDKNGPIAGPEMESCPRQCTVCPDAVCHNITWSLMWTSVLQFSWNGTDRCYASQLCYAVIFCSLKRNRKWNSLSPAVTRQCYVTYLYSPLLDPCLTSIAMAMVVHYIFVCHNITWSLMWVSIATITNSSWHYHPRQHANATVFSNLATHILQVTIKWSWMVTNRILQVTIEWSRLVTNTWLHTQQNTSLMIISS